MGGGELLGTAPACECGEAGELGEHGLGLLSGTRQERAPACSGVAGARQGDEMGRGLSAQARCRAQRLRRMRCD